MAASPTVSCPYCLSGIPAGASVCAHCGRDVRLLQEARERIRALEAEVAALRATVPQPVTEAPRRAPLSLPRRPLALLALWGYYAASVAAFLFLGDGSMRDTALLCALGAAAGVLLAVADRGTNVWLLAMYGLVQPTLLVLFALPLGGIDLTDEFLRYFLFTGVAVAVSVAAGGAAAVQLRLRDRRSTFFVTPQWGMLLGRTEAEVGRINNLLAQLGAIGGMLYMAFSFLLGDG